MAQSKRIYIVPQSGIYEGRVIALDHVSGFNFKSLSVVANHPIESQNQNIADHRYHQSKTVTMSGMVSDNWDTKIIYEPTPVFQTTYQKQEKALRIAVENNVGKDSDTYKVVTKILDEGSALNSEIVALPDSSQFYAVEALRLRSSEKDVIQTAQEKGQSITASDDNFVFLNNVINTITQVQEALKYFDDNDTLLTIVSLRNTYENMVLIDFNNTLRNGPERGAYWVDLVFREEFIATGVTNDTVIDFRTSEEVDETSDKGKVNRDISNRNQLTEAVDQIYNEAFNSIAIPDNILLRDLNKASGNDPGAAVRYIKERGLDTYSDKQDALATKLVMANLIREAYASFGKPSWEGYKIPGT